MRKGRNWKRRITGDWQKTTNERTSVPAFLANEFRRLCKLRIFTWKAEPCLDRFLVTRDSTRSAEQRRRQLTTCWRN